MIQHTGVLHVHSTYSRDGHHPLHEIVAFGRRRGFRFICMTEHAESLTPTSFGSYLAECRHLSSSECCLVPGLEIDCTDGLHMMGLGLTSYVEPGCALRVATAIQDSGGIAVIAHPGRYAYRIPPALALSVHGIEVWNQGYDGRFLPNPHSLTLLRQFRRENPAVYAFGGVDLHRISPVSHVRTFIRARSSTPECVLSALRIGDFRIEGRWFRLDSGGVRLNSRWLPLLAARGAYTFAREIRRRLRPSLQS